VPDGAASVGYEAQKVSAGWRGKRAAQLPRTQRVAMNISTNPLANLGRLLAFLAFACTSTARASIVESGHSAIWFDPARDGEGLTLQVLDDERAVLAIFTFDEAGGQRWLLDLGRIVREGDDEFIEFPTLTATRGAQFGEDFDPSDVVREVVGQATLRFTDCDRGTLVYTAYGQTQTIQIQRLTRTMGAGCGPINGVLGAPIRSYAGESGSWFDTSHDGEGFMLQWLAQDEAVVVWYTYDSQGRQYWLFGSGGRREGNKIVFPLLHSARGGRFGADFDPADVQLVEWGRLELDLDCSEGGVSYTSVLPEFGSGTQTLTRLLQLQRPGCPSVNPKLTDLYTIEVTEFPIAPGTPMDGNFILAQSVANDGTVAAIVRTSSNNKLLRRRPGASDWEVLSGPDLSAQPFAMIAPQGDLILANLHAPRQPVFFRAGVRESVSGLIYDESYVTGASENLHFVLGNGRTTGDPALYPWIWNEARGQVNLPVNSETRGSEPRAASNEGNIVVGYRIVPNCGPQGCVVAGTAGVRWADQGPAQFLRDSIGRDLGGATACSADCRIVFGADSLIEGSVSQAYYWMSPTQSGYLGVLDGVIEDQFGSSYYIADVAADGSLAVGRYNVLGRTVGNAIQVASGGLIWTQNTGLLPINELLDEINQPLDWDEMAAVSVSSDGRWILLQGEKGSGAQARPKAAALRLEPRIDSP